MALCRAVLAGMKERRRGKIINLSGGGATGPRANFSAYATAKAGLVRFSETLAEETRHFGIDVNCIAPGFMRSRMTDETLAAGPQKAGFGELAQIERLMANAADNPRRAAALAVWLASAGSDGITGRLISAVWDPWETLADHARELRESDIYTLRRIVPKDRGLDWGER
jgi:3-oxoacyl-[acyl-carrier protein] reductase